MNLTKTALASVAILFISKALGIVREMALAYSFGISYIVDAYTVSIAVPGVIFGIYASGFSQSYIPACMGIKPDERDKFFSSAMTILTMISLLVAVGCFWGSENLADIMAPGVSLRTRELIIYFIRGISFMLPSMLVFNILAVHAQVHESFIATDLCNTILIQVIIIISIFMASQGNEYVLIYGYVFAQNFATILLFVYMKYKKMFVYRFSLDVFDENFKVLCRMAIPLGASIIVNRINIVTDKMFAAGLGEGVIGALNYADRMQLVAYSFTTAVFITLCYPRISRFFAIGERQAGMEYVHKAVTLTGYVSFPLMLLFSIFSESIVKLTFARGAFYGDSVTMTAYCLSAYSVGMIFYSLREITTRLLAVCRKQNLILKNTLFSVLANIMFNCLFIKFFGYIGIALATSLSGMLAFLLMLRDVYEQKIVLFIDEQIRELRLIMLIALIANGICWMTNWGLVRYCEPQMAFLIGVCAAVISYISLSVAVKLNIFVWVYKKLPPQYQIISFL